MYIPDSTCRYNLHIIKYVNNFFSVMQDFVEKIEISVR